MHYFNHQLPFSRRIQIFERTSYTVPAGFYFMATAFASVSWSPASRAQDIHMVVNGTRLFSARTQWEDLANSPGSDLTDIALCPAGHIAKSGDVVTCESNQFAGASVDAGTIIGYLVPNSGLSDDFSEPGAIPPGDWVRITEGTPYNVPAGKFFSLTGLGILDGYPSDIQEELAVTFSNGANPVMFTRLHWRNDLNQSVRHNSQRIALVPHGCSFRGDFAGNSKTVIGQLVNGETVTKQVVDPVSIGGILGSVSAPSLPLSVSSTGSNTAYATGFLKDLS